MFNAKIQHVAGLLITVTSAAWLPGCGQPLVDPPNVIVEKRAQARWDRLIQGDMEGAYGYLSPEERQQTSLEAFKGRFGGVVAWTDAEVLEVTCESAECFVKLQIRYKAMLPQMALTGEVENMRFIRERWINAADNWWKTESRATQKEVDVPSG